MCIGHALCTKQLMIAVYVLFEQKNSLVTDVNPSLTFIFIIHFKCMVLIPLSGFFLFFSDVFISFVPSIFTKILLLTVPQTQHIYFLVLKYLLFILIFCLLLNYVYPYLIICTV
jgi:hypothetical protein